MTHVCAHNRTVSPLENYIENLASAWKEFHAEVRTMPLIKTSVMVNRNLIISERLKSL